MLPDTDLYNQMDPKDPDPYLFPNVHCSSKMLCFVIYGFPIQQTVVHRTASELQDSSRQGPNQSTTNPSGQLTVSLRI